MAWNYEYPYVDPNRFNSDWILGIVKKMEEVLETLDLLTPEEIRKIVDDEIDNNIEQAVNELNDIINIKLTSALYQILSSNQDIYKHVITIQNLLNMLKSVKTDYVIDPTSGHGNSLQGTLNNIWNGFHFLAIIAVEYDNLKIRAKEYDDLNISATNYDLFAKWYLYKYYKDKKVRIPLNGRKSFLNNTLSYLSFRPIQINNSTKFDLMTCAEYDAKNITANEFDMSAFNCLVADIYINKYF